MLQPAASQAPVSNNKPLRIGPAVGHATPIVGRAKQVKRKTRGRRPLDPGPASAYIEREQHRSPPLASARFEEIADDFAFLDDWEDRYRYVIELGRAMPPLEDALKVPATKVEGC